MQTAGSMRQLSGLQAFGQLSVSSMTFAGKTAPSFPRIMLEETQKAPSTIALTKTNAAQIASTLSFIVTSTRRASIAAARNRKFNRK
jgi:hypothetical protein